MMKVSIHLEIILVLIFLTDCNIFDCIHTVSKVQFFIFSLSRGMCWVIAIKRGGNVAAWFMCKCWGSASVHLIMMEFDDTLYPLDTGRRLNVHMTFNLHPVPRGYEIMSLIEIKIIKKIFKFIGLSFRMLLLTRLFILLCIFRYLRPLFIEI